MTEYEKFIAQKQIVMPSVGISPKPVHKRLFDYQAAVSKLALRKGRFCVWADCGLGKTEMQVEWASQIPGNVLIVAPLAVAEQTIKEAALMGVKIKYCRHQSEVVPGISITNYEMLHEFDSAYFKGLALDESGILKSLDGKTRNFILSEWLCVPYRSAYTATPAPNDYMEIGSHSEFVGAMKMSEMLSMFFVHDGGETQKWRLKKHATNDFWKWVCSWAIMFRKPSDLGFSDKGFELPPLEVQSEVVESNWKKENYYGLLPYEAKDLRERITARKESVSDRVKTVADRINKSKETWLVWGNLNSECDLLAKSIEGSEQVSGSDSMEAKIKKLSNFISGKTRVLITKPKIAGHGLNLQHCHNVCFVGLSDSWEQYYQATRRCWRFGQKHKVNVFIVISRAEGSVLQNILRKDRDADAMMNKMVQIGRELNIQHIQEKTVKKEDVYMEQKESGKKWIYYLGDCVEAIRNLKNDSVDYSIYSPPFSSLYTYSASPRDMGNSVSDIQFFAHIRFLANELIRVVKPGRLISFHCMNLPTSKTNQGYIGIRDFRGDLIRGFEQEGWVFHSEAVIWKDPVTAMQRTKAIGLLHKQLKKDSSISRQGIPDYLVTMRKRGDNKEPICRDGNQFPVSLWQKWASPVWMDIRPSDTLQYRSVREHNDERHICPLQLEVIRRGILMWSNLNDIVFSPFGGIASEGVVALECGRRFIGVELKKSYWKQGVANLKQAEMSKRQTLLPIDV